MPSSNKMNKRSFCSRASANPAPDPWKRSPPLRGTIRGARSSHECEPTPRTSDTGKSAPPNGPHPGPPVGGNPLHNPDTAIASPVGEFSRTRAARPKATLGIEPWQQDCLPTSPSKPTFQAQLQARMP